MPMYIIQTSEPATMQYQYEVQADSLLFARQAVLEQQGNYVVKLVKTTCHENGKIEIDNISEVAPAKLTPIKLTPAEFVNSMEPKVASIDNWRLLADLFLSKSDAVDESEESDYYHECYSIACCKAERCEEEIVSTVKTIIHAL